MTIAAFSGFNTSVLPLWNTPGRLLLAEARIFIDWSDAANHSGKYAKNQNDARTITHNMVAFPTGPMVNESGSVSPARTIEYANGPGGTLTAMRVQSTGTNQAMYMFRSSLPPLPPNGTYSLRFRARSTSGTGSWAISFGLASAYAAGTVQDLDWTNPVNDAATTFSCEFTYAGASDMAIKIALASADILIDRIQLHEGTLASMPAWATHVTSGGRKGVSFTNSLALDGNGLADTTGQPAGMLVFDPDFPAKHTYNAYTVMSVGSLNATPVAVAHIANAHPNDGGTTTGNVLISEGGAPYAGEVNAYASSLSRAYHAANLAGYGVFISGHGRDATTRRTFIDTVPAYIEASVFAGVTASRFTQGGFTTTNVADLRGNLATGKYAYYVRWDRLLTDAEWIDVANEIRTRLATRGVALAPMTDYHVISGDSNSTRSNGDWTQLVTGKDYLTPQRNLIMSVTSVGGQKLNDLEHDASGAESGLADGVITVNGRYGKKDKPALVGGVEDGRYSLYHLPIGTNDSIPLEGYVGTDAAAAAAYCLRLQTGIIAEALALSTRVHVMWYSLMPMTTTSRSRWESIRLLINSQMASWIASQPRVHLSDFGGSATIGSRALQAGGGGTYFLSDEIHLTAAGDVEAAAISGAAVKAWRTSLGIA